MSSRDARAYLCDIVDACEVIREVMGTDDFTDYAGDLKSRLAVERELISLGEAVARLLETAPEVVHEWEAPARPIVGLRNVLVHGYFKVDDVRIFETASGDVPKLRAEAERTLRALERPTNP